MKHLKYILSAGLLMVVIVATAQPPVRKLISRSSSPSYTSIKRLNQNLKSSTSLSSHTTYSSRPVSNTGFQRDQISKNSMWNNNKNSLELVGKRFVKKTEVRKSTKAPGQSRAVYTSYRNQDGKKLKAYKDSYDRANKFQHRKHKSIAPPGGVKKKN